MTSDQSRVCSRNTIGGMRTGSRLTFVCTVLFLAHGGEAGDSSCPTGENHERWAIKTSANAQQAVTVTLKQLKNLQVPSQSAAGAVKNKGGLLQGEFKTDGLSLKEGQMVQTTGWLHLANFDSGDSDYHLQLTEDPTGCASGCVIVEIPRDTCAAEPSEATRWHFLGSRSSVDVDFARVSAGQFSIGQTASDSGKQGEILVKPIFVQVEGQLFFDTAHYPTANKPGGDRGKDGCLANTVWEIHPVTNITVLKSDGTPHKSSDRFIPTRHRHPLGAPHSRPTT